MNEFKKLGIIEPILKVIGEEGFEEPSEIQKRSIPPGIKGRDVLAGSATGSGKTLAFAAGIIQHTENINSVLMEISFPNRVKTLAQQTWHLIPAALTELLTSIDQNFPIWLFHMKPQYMK